MKYMLKFVILTLTMTCGVLSSNATTNTTSSAAPSEDLGFDFYQGRSNKVAKVYAATPTHIQVQYENGSLSRQILRTELSGELARRYPYEAERATAYQAQKSTEAAQRTAAQQVAWQAAQQSAQNQREKIIEAEISRLSQRDTELQKEVNVLRDLPRGNGRKVRLAYLRAEQQSIREKQIKLRSQLSALR